MSCGISRRLLVAEHLETANVGIVSPVVVLSIRLVEDLGKVSQVRNTRKQPNFTYFDILSTACLSGCTRLQYVHTCARLGRTKIW